jgi:hypothetical protein
MVLVRFALAKAGARRRLSQVGLAALRQVALRQVALRVAAPDTPVSDGQTPPRARPSAVAGKSVASSCARAAAVHRTALPHNRSATL